MQSSKQPDEQEDSRLLRYLPGTLSWLDEDHKTGQKVRLFGLGRILTQTLLPGLNISIHPDERQLVEKFDPSHPILSCPGGIMLAA